MNKLLEFEINIEDVKIDKTKLLGHGKWGYVYLAEWKKTPVAVKIADSEQFSLKKEMYQRELEIMSKIYHPNIVQFLGFIKNPFTIVMEYVGNKSLLNLINDQKSSWLSINKKIDICLDILKGINYLHTRFNNNIIHRDIKLDNVLLTDTYKAKIIDFGLSRIVNKKLNTIEYTYEENNLVMGQEIVDLTYPVGTKRYMSPEIKNNNIYSYKTDIWSIGILFIELFEDRRYFLEDFIWYKTPIGVQKIIAEYMIMKNPDERLDASNLIDLFVLEKKKKTKFMLSILIFYIQISYIY